MNYKNSFGYFSVINLSFDFLKLFINNNNNPKGVKAL